MQRKGRCLCGALRYEIEGELAGVWMCHCSNCRKTSGATGNTIEEDEKNIYVTAGTLDEPLGAGIENHIFCGSRADWDRDGDGARYFVERSTGSECSDRGHDHVRHSRRGEP